MEVKLNIKCDCGSELVTSEERTVDEYIHLTHELGISSKFSFKLIEDGLFSLNCYKCNKTFHVV